MWRIGDKGVLPGYPVLIHQFWSELPHNLTHIDAVYQRIDNHIAFFIGKSENLPYLYTVKMRL
jgi:hypothetical protein